MVEQQAREQVAAATQAEREAREHAAQAEQEAADAREDLARIREELSRAREELWRAREELWRAREEPEAVNQAAEAEAAHEARSDVLPPPDAGDKPGRDVSAPTDRNPTRDRWSRWRGRRSG